MADINEQGSSSVMALLTEHAQMIQELMSQQAETEETSGYQVRDLQKQIVGLRKQRADDLAGHEERIRDLQEQLDGKDIQIEALQSHSRQLTDSVRHSATDAATEVLDQYNKATDKMANNRLNKLEEKTSRIVKMVEEAKRNAKSEQDDMDVQVESIGARLCQLKEEIRSVDSDAIAKTVAEIEEKGGRLIRERLDELEQQVAVLVQGSMNATRRLQGLKVNTKNGKIAK